MAKVLGIVDGLFGDSGKGTMVDAYAQNADAITIVRFNGGAQALHHVVTNDGMSHGFSQLGSASFHPKAETHLSRFMLVYPTNLLSEMKQLQHLGVSDLPRRVTIHRCTPLITPWHRAANWLREIARGNNQHGSCGMGIGELMQDIEQKNTDILCADDLKDTRILGIKSAQIRHRKRQELQTLIAALPAQRNELTQQALSALESDDVYTTFVDNCKRLSRCGIRIVDNLFLRNAVKRPGLIIGEGAQGVLLDEWFGFHPHTTWSTTTYHNLDILLSESDWTKQDAKLVVLRAYATRHGTGPLITHDTALTNALPEQHNRNDGWQGLFRCGWFDSVAVRYGLNVLGHVDGIALTCLDRLKQYSELRLCIAYRYKGPYSSSELSQFFFLDEKSVLPRIIGIRLGRKGNLKYQAALTSHLFHCEPEYVQIPSNQFVNYLEALLNVPIVVTSHGQTAEDKIFRHALPNL